VSKVFSRELVNLYQDHNFFGCESDGQSEEQQEALKKAWIGAMANRGYILGETLIDIDWADEYERDGIASLKEASKIVNAQ
jgi:hypothetical protein